MHVDVALAAADEHAEELRDNQHSLPDWKAYDIAGIDGAGCPGSAYSSSAMSRSHALAVFPCSEMTVSHVLGDGSGSTSG